MLLLVLAMLAVSLSFSSRSRRPPTIHHMPEGLLSTLISSVFRASISPICGSHVSQGLTAIDADHDVHPMLRIATLKRFQFQEYRPPWRVRMTALSSSKRARAVDPR